MEHENKEQEEDRWTMKEKDGFVWFIPKNPEIAIAFIENLIKACHSLRNGFDK